MKKKYAHKHTHLHMYTSNILVSKSIQLNKMPSEKRKLRINGMEETKRKMLSTLKMR